MINVDQFILSKRIIFLIYYREKGTFQREQGSVELEYIPY